MSARNDLIKALTEAGFTVDPTNTDSRYTDGIVYVMSSTYSVVDFENVINVIGAVNVTQDIDAYARRLLQAVRDTHRFVPRSMSFDYGSEPIPGRELKIADSVTIEVVSGETI